ncbi:hypothetical protein [Ralstonia pseudosolanacearum]|uniref:hypothetical protein n=1 Tax=Ralstonia pseudosolanacearum TaxID=1310165 RepID=UPI002234CC46|nr:hypothetical protein [Ralstonia sp. RS647]UZF35241.1 hypothetical protein LGV81_00690 [Ralstonia sp. RS647]
MKKLGLIGGIGPESTVAYYRKIIHGVQEKAGRENLPRLSIESLRARLKIPRRCGVKAGCGKKKIESVRRSWLGRPSVTRAT